MPHDLEVRRLACLLLLSACAPPEAPPVSTHAGDWRDEVIYQIVVDRFDDGDTTNDVVDGIGPERSDLARFHGGDWAGVRQRLDYIEALGATTIWISPPYANVQRTELEDGYHGYWPADFTEANPRFGDLEELRALVRDAHDRDMLVILDVVPNHAGRVFNYDLDADGTVGPGEVEPPYSADGPHAAPLLWSHRPRMHGPEGVFTLEERHFHRRGAGDFSIQSEKELGDFPTGLRDLDTESPEVIDALVETHVAWVRDTDVDGFRIDAVPHAPHAFWAAFCRRLRARLAELGKRDFLLVGEVFTGDPTTLASYTAVDELDAAFAFDLKYSLIDDVILSGGAPALARAPLVGNRALFPASGQPGGVPLSPWEARVAFADNHDVWRVRGELDDPLAAALALAVVFTVDAIPSVYYGTEQGLRGQVHHESREPLFLEAPDFPRDSSTFQLIGALAEIRARSRALRRGELVLRYASTSGGADLEPAADAGMLAYERAQGDERVLIVLNTSLDESIARFDVGYGSGTRLFDALGGTEAPWTVAADGSLEIRLPGRAVVILEGE